MPIRLAPRSRARGPSDARAPLSGDAISPDHPPDPQDSFRLLVEGAGEYAVFALSPSGIVSTWNLGAERIEGYRPDEIIGRHFSVFYPAGQQEAGVPERELDQVLTEGQLSVEGWRVRRDGSQFWASVVIMPLWDGAGRLRGFAALTRDDTERCAARQLHERLARVVERDNITSLLADTLARRLFKIGLDLAGVLSLATGPEQRHKTEEAISETDIAINELRNAVFAMATGRNAHHPGAPPGPTLNDVP